MKSSILGVALGLALSLMGFFLAARYIKEPPEIVTIWPVALAVLVMVAVWFIQGAIIALLAKPRLGEVRLREMTRVYLATQAAGAVTPFAGGEIAYQLLELDRRGLSADMGGAVIAIRSILNGATLAVGTAIGLLFVPYIPFVGSSSSLPFSAYKAFLVVAIVLILVGGLVAAVVARRRQSQNEDSRERGRRERLLDWLSGLRGRISDYLRHLRSSLLWIWRQEPRVVFACVGLMMLYWILYPLLGTLALRASGWSGVGWVHVYLAQYVLFFVIPLAPTPGNSGAAELAFVALMGDYVPHTALLGGVLIWRALNHYSELVIGAFIAGRNLPEDVKVAKREFESD